MVGLSPAPGEEAAMTAIASEVPVTMRKVFRRLERWRRQRQGRERIPQRLWVAAGELARQHGVNPVSRVLGLDFNRLKRMAGVEAPCVPQASRETLICGTDRAAGHDLSTLRDRVGRATRQDA